MSNRLHHLALGTRSVERLAFFYREALGLREVDRHVLPDGALRSVWLDLGGPLLMIERTDSPPCPVETIGSGLFLLAIRVTKRGRRACEARLEAFGAHIESRTAWSSYTRDPDGNRIAVSHYPSGTE